jgi:Holliday junction resolvase
MNVVGRNRANGKRYEGELVKAIRARGIYARLGRSNEEADVILPNGMLTEVKSSSRKNFSLNHDRETKDQFHRLLEVPGRVFYAVRYQEASAKPFPSQMTSAGPTVTRPGNLHVN